MRYMPSTPADEAILRALVTQFYDRPTGGDENYEAHIESSDQPIIAGEVPALLFVGPSVLRGANMLDGDYLPIFLHAEVGDDDQRVTLHWRLPTYPLAMPTEEQEGQYGFWPIVHYP